MNTPFPQLDTQPFAAGSRIALALAYRGGDFKGWQSQGKPRVNTAQDCLETALAKITNQPVSLVCAGRTDAGVHASYQVVHFDLPCPRSEKALVMGCNSNLPDSLAVKWVRSVDPDFHARFSATARRYRYIILNRPLRDVHMSGLVTQYAHPLDAALMNDEAQALVGEQDFSAFRAASCQSRTPMRNIHFISVKRRGDYVVIDLQGNAFLHHMVRNIAGVLMAVGSGQMPAGWTAEVLASCDRTQGGVTARPEGLYLVDVSYPAHFALPENQPGPAFLADISLAD
ncbi:tRNA pseudouridine(38-40) synthase TruA [Spongiibacter sp. KMU-158]|uniref:tRNA pseudouridine synthase A n=1 Tax=Spongiibacter pelagi TaxID=2760804 RepID=A0A927C0K5_9GAMM|nr:tRNA pseudouridine(38-40) synthase TruA [Spongiibacter pelagi]MBD2859049.1 tRNA pseudouridine(38-40) synthase TruA [Spongiibacter pelagi]